MKKWLLSALGILSLLAIASLFWDSSRDENDSAGAPPPGAPPGPRRPPRFVKKEPPPPRLIPPPEAGEVIDAVKGLKPRAPGRLYPIRAQYKGLKAYDEAAFRALVDEGRRRYLTSGGGIPDCAQAYLNRADLRRWSIDETILLKITTTGERMRFAEVSFLDEQVKQPSDGTFRECYRAAVKRMEIACPGCREGQVTIPWRVRGLTYKRGLPPNRREGERDPAQDPGFRLRDN